MGTAINVILTILFISIVVVSLIAEVKRNEQKVYLISRGWKRVTIDDCVLYEKDGSTFPRGEAYERQKDEDLATCF